MTKSGRKDSSILMNCTVRMVMKVLKLKNRLTEKAKKRCTFTGPQYALRVNKDPSAPYVRAASRSPAYGNHDRRPMARLQSARSMADLFRIAVDLHGKNMCMGMRKALKYTTVKDETGKEIRKIEQHGYMFYSYEQVDEMIDYYAQGIKALGVRARENVAIFADTCFEWMCLAQALMRNNCTIVTLYATLSDEGVLYGMRETQSTMVVTTRELLEKMSKSFAQLSHHLKNIVYIERVDGPAPDPIPGIKTLNVGKLRQLGEGALKSSSPQKNHIVRDGPGPSDVAIIMYTSGSTGTPKGVELTHQNMLCAAQGLSEVFASMEVRPDDSYVAYLPLAHVFELNCEMIAILFGVKIGYSSPHTLTDSSMMVMAGQQGDCALLQPTILPAVPLMLDRVKKAITGKIADQNKFTQCLFDTVVNDKVRAYDMGIDFTDLDKDVFSKIREVVGGRVRLIATGSAPLSAETHSFIRAVLGCVVLQGYGLTETCAAATVMLESDRSVGCVGGPVSGAYIRLVDWPEGNYFARESKGEILIGGGMVARGYYKNKKLTEESFFEEDGVWWFRTGDIGEVTEEGNFKIIDRKKDLVKLQHGEYVSLGKIETEIKTLCSVDNICIYGSGLESFLVAIVQPNRRQFEILAQQMQKTELPFEKLCHDIDMKNALLEEIQTHLRQRKFLRVEIPQKLMVCAEEWTPESGLVTAAMKLCRKPVLDKYATELSEMCQ